MQTWSDDLSCLCSITTVPIVTCWAPVLLMVELGVMQIISVHASCFQNADFSMQKALVADQLAAVRPNFFAEKVVTQY